MCYGLIDYNGIQNCFHNFWTCYTLRVMTFKIKIFGKFEVGWTLKSLIMHNNSPFFSKFVTYLKGYFSWKYW
jgi:hypothetical protein